MQRDKQGITEKYVSRINKTLTKVSSCSTYNRRLANIRIIRIERSRLRVKKGKEVGMFPGVVGWIRPRPIGTSGTFFSMPPSTDRLYGG
jgi:hypothetical protein